MISVCAQYVKGNDQEPWLTVMFLYQLTVSKPSKKLQIYEILPGIYCLLTEKHIIAGKPNIWTYCRQLSFVLLISMTFFEGTNTVIDTGYPVFI